MSNKSKKCNKSRKGSYFLYSYEEEQSLLENLDNCNQVLIEKLRGIIPKLTFAQQEVINLRFYKNMTYQRIAQELGWSYIGVYHTLNGCRVAGANMVKYRGMIHGGAIRKLFKLLHKNKEFIESLRLKEILESELSQLRSGS